MNRQEILQGEPDLHIGKTRVWYMGTLEVERGHVPDWDTSEHDSFVYEGERIFHGGELEHAQTMWTRGHPFGLFLDAWLFECAFAGIGIRYTDDCATCGAERVEVYEFMS